MLCNSKRLKSSSLRYNQDKFRSQLHRTDPRPFSPRWLSGHGLVTAVRNKRHSTAPKTQEIHRLSKRSFAERSTDRSSVRLDHQIHRKSRPITAPEQIYRVWDSTAPVPYRFKKQRVRELSDSTLCRKNRESRGGGIFINRARPGKRQVEPKKCVYPDVPRISPIRMFPQMKLQTFDKPNSSFVLHDPSSSKKIHSKPTKIQDYLSPKSSWNAPRARCSYPRQDLTDVWKCTRPQTTPLMRRGGSLMGNILSHTY